MAKLYVQGTEVNFGPITASHVNILFQDDNGNIYRIGAGSDIGGDLEPFRSALLLEESPLRSRLG